ncbi:MAG: translation initiation factor IF-2 [Actinomycetota bacterium]
MRVYEIARENKITSKKLIEMLKEKGIEVKSHMSTLTPAQEKKVKGLFKKKTEGKKVKANWEEEKRRNIRSVLDKELDKEEKSGRIRVRSTPKKKAVKKEDSKKGTKDSEVKEKKQRPQIKKVLELPDRATIKQISERVSIPSSEMIQTLFNMGEMVNINQPLDKDLVEILSNEYNFKYNIIGFEEKFDEIYDDSEKDLKIRPPIVTVMGHVDHGKTTLLDAIRNTKVASSEAGGITQDIGAYQIMHSKRKITFIDTPGHEAFTTMRARGARVTDIAIIVVAANDGIMPQTVEAIDHAKAAKVPIIVAINKIDLPNADPNKVKQGLTEYDLVPEEWGGDTICVEISAEKKTNIGELLEMILLVADMNEIKGNPSAEASAIIIESRLDKRMGPIATVIVKRGTLKIGDNFVTGNSMGRIRSLMDENGDRIEEAVLSQPVEILGFSTVPQAGDKLFVVKNEKVAKDIISRKEYDRKMSQVSESKKTMTLEELSKLSEQEEVKVLGIVLKSDSNGSLDAVEKGLNQIQEENININIIHKGVGAITDSDIILAAASGSIVIGFGVVPASGSKQLAKQEGVEIRTYNIIYKLIDDVKLAFKGLLEPKIEKVEKGKIEVRELFKIPKVGSVAGCYVLEGEAERGNLVRIVRDGKIIYESRIGTIHRFKEDVKKVSAGYECGIRIENFQDINKGDIIEVFEEQEVEQ